MEEHGPKITWKIILTILIIVGIFYFLIFLLNYDPMEAPKDIKQDDSNGTFVRWKNNTDFDTYNSTVLLETDDFIVLNRIYRKDKIFTQGLFMDTPDTFIESGGLYDHSSLRRFNITNPDRPLYKKGLIKRYFAEGCTLFKGKIYQLTWDEGIM
jgi:hypothetical protein